MRVTLKNQHDTNIAEADVLVGCGLDGDENNEPSFRYTINPDGLRIQRETDDGSRIGYADLNNLDLDRLCRVPGAAKPTEGASLLQGDDATAKLQQLLDIPWAVGSTQVWVLGKHRQAWSQLESCELDTALASQAVLINYVNKAGEAYKYTFYPKNNVGLLLAEF